MATKASKMMLKTGKGKARPVNPLPSLQSLRQGQPEVDLQNPLDGETREAFSADASAPQFQFSGDDPELSQGADADGGEGVQAGAAVLSKDEFFAAFKVMHQAPNLLPLPPFPVAALPIKSEEMDGARMASDAIHDVACETPWLRWLVEPQSLWMQRALVIASYALPKAMAVAAELKAKRAKPVDPAPENAAADDLQNAMPGVAA